GYLGYGVRPSERDRRRGHIENVVQRKVIASNAWRQPGLQWFHLKARPLVGSLDRTVLPVEQSLNETRHVDTVSFRRLVRNNGRAKGPGAQTERKALASTGASAPGIRPVRTLLGGEDSPAEFLLFVSFSPISSAASV